MKNVLIPTMPYDTHALYVKLALEKRGHSATLMYTADIPQQQAHSFTLKNESISWVAHGTELSIDDNHYDVVWHRRPRRPILPSTLHIDDMKNAASEFELFYRMIWHVICPKANWINPVASLPGANCKLLQLQIAKSVGMNIPLTLMSNEPEMIKEFISDYRSEGVIYKNIMPDSMG